MKCERICYWLLVLLKYVNPLFIVVGREKIVA